MKSAIVLCLVLTFLGSGSSTETDPSKFPVPPYLKKSLFFIHRSTNSNTVLYDLNLLPDNSIDPKNPVKVYWIRYGEKGQTRTLNYLEKTFAYGVKSSPLTDSRFLIEFVASNTKKFEVYVDANGQAQALMNIGGRSSNLRKIFVHVAEDGWWPKIDYVDFFGLDASTNSPTYERMKI